MKIAVTAEMAPAKAFIPIIKQLDAEIICLTHSQGVEELMGRYCSEVHSIGKSRGQGAQKRSNAKIASLVFKDIWSTVKSLRGKNVDMLLTCGNAGDVRKGIAASKLLQIPTLHIEQDIYNPIEMIAFSNLITVPSVDYKNFVVDKYGFKNVKIIGGYPMASYVSEIHLDDVNEVKSRYEADEFLVLVFGGDVKGEDIPDIVKDVETLERDVLVVPFRFDADYVRSCITSPNLRVLDGYVDLPSLMKASSGIVYAAGMGLTIEAGVLKVPAVKVAGFHRKHASVDLARELGIEVAEIGEISSAVNSMQAPNGNWLIEGGKKAASNVVEIVNNFESEKGHNGGYSSMKKIWAARSEFR